MNLPLIGARWPDPLGLQNGPWHEVLHSPQYKELEDSEEKHYRLINNMSRLLSNQVSKHKKAKQYCLRCLSHFSSREKLALHKEYCSRNDAVRIEIPDEGSMLKFKNHNRSIRVALWFMLTFRHVLNQ